MPSNATTANGTKQIQSSPTEATVTSLYRAAIGPINTDYYLPILTRFETAGQDSASWNWAACMCKINWMAFRNLWEAALIYTATMLTLLLLFGVGKLILQWSEPTEMTVL